MESKWTYSMLVSCDSLCESFVETQDTNNNSANTASDISVGSQYKGVLACNDDKDYYKFTLAEQSKLTVNITNSAEDTMKYTIYDSFVNSSYTDTISKEKKQKKPLHWRRVRIIWLSRRKKVKLMEVIILHCLV